MAVCKTKPSSLTFSNSRQIQDSSFLYLLEDSLFWKGDLESLKEFINTDLQISGRWSSPRGETTQFSNPEFCLKWPLCRSQKMRNTQIIRSTTWPVLLLRTVSMTIVVVNVGTTKKKQTNCFGKRNEKTARRRSEDK